MGFTKKIQDLLDVASAKLEIVSTRVVSWLRRFVKCWFNLYDISDLQVGANCGCCGAMILEEIVPSCWVWSLCQSCISSGQESIVDDVR